MNRTTYLQSYKDGISIFEESYQQRKVLDLDEQITKLVDSGKTEEEALKELGDVQVLIQDILKENHVDLSHLQKKQGVIASSYDQLFHVIEHVVEVMSKNSAKANGKILFDILILLFLTCVLKVPFILVRDLGFSLLEFVSSPILNKVWQLLIEVIYIIVAITFFFHVFKKWFEKLKITK